MAKSKRVVAEVLPFADFTARKMPEDPEKWFLNSPVIMRVDLARFFAVSAQSITADCKTLKLDKGQMLTGYQAYEVFLMNLYRLTLAKRGSDVLAELPGRKAFMDHRAECISEDGGINYTEIVNWLVSRGTTVTINNKPGYPPTIKAFTKLLAPIIQERYQAKEVNSQGPAIEVDVIERNFDDENW